jgi:molybdate transport system regulatory protein
MQPRLSIRLYLPNGERIGPGKVALLEAIQGTGSISSAAARLHMSYSRAFLLVREINSLLREPAVVAVRGGWDGGNAELTSSGKEIIKRYRNLQNRVHAVTRGDCRLIGKLSNKNKLV